MTSFKESMFHLNEFAICGYSNTGKTTLIEKLIHDFSSINFKVGAIKHDGHSFDMDKDDKDTCRFKNAGATTVLINDSSKYAIQNDEAYNSINNLAQFIDLDFVLVEGNKSCAINKLVIVDKHLEILDFIEQNKVKNILGFIAIDENMKRLLKERYSQPVFLRDAVKKISLFILKRFQKNTPPLKALILAGGKSQRMGEDKGKLQYFDKFQTQHLYETISPFVDDVYVSIRKDQENEEHVKDLKQIQDCFPSIGPMSAILSAMHLDPHASWLVVAVDLPYLDTNTINDLIRYRNPYKLATCFKNPEKGWPEPLCTIWEPKSKIRLHQYFAMSRFCPRKILFNSEIELLKLDNSQALDNCNTFDDYLNAKKIFQKKGESHATN